MQDFRDKVALLLGASHAVGGQLARACLERGMRVLADKPPPRPWDSRVELVPGERLLEMGPPDLVVNATRLCQGGNAWETGWPDWREVVEGHLAASLRICDRITRIHPSAHTVTLSWTDPGGCPFLVAQRAVLALQQNLSVSTAPGRTHVLFVDGLAPAIGADELFVGVAEERFYLGVNAGLERRTQERLNSLLVGEQPGLGNPKVAVITGAAGGIGLALARQCLSQGMQVVLSDVHRADLEQAAGQLPVPPSQYLCFPADVSQNQQVEQLAQAALERFGAVDLLVNNAGVGAGGSPLECTPNDWNWVMGVNFWGVVAAVKVFVPLMLSQGQPARILNTASLAGLLAYHPSACYQVSKHAVVALSEALRDSLRDTCIDVSVLCPGYVNTRILSSSRNRPLHWKDEDRPPPRHLRLLQAALRKGMAPEAVAERAWQGMEQGRFYLFTHPEMHGGIEENLGGLLERRNPLNPNRLAPS